MTTAQLVNLNTNLKPSAVTLKELETSDGVRNQLVYFFYQLKHNHDNYQKGLHICPIKITWDITSPLTSGVLNFSKDQSITAILAVKLYKYILMTSDTSQYISYTLEALRLDNLFKKQAYHYFKENKCCDNQTILNYNKYFFMQTNKFKGNR
jgi:hypothetical protein